MRILTGLLIVVLAATGCAPRYHPSVHTPQPDPATVPSAGTPASADVWRGLAKKMTPGSGVRVVLTDGRRMRAVLLSADDAAIVVKPRTRVPEPEQRIAYGNVEILEIDTNTGIGAGKAIAIGVGTGAAAFLGMLLITFAIVSD